MQTIVSMVDHTLLTPTATWADIRALCDEAMAYGTASVCIPPVWVKEAKAYVGDRIAVCTVIGFPNGYATTAVKCLECEDALKNGADEIDMVIQLGWVREGAYDCVLEEIRAIKAVCGEHILKVIIETCMLTEDEKIRLCEVVSASGADYIKTSTGFSTGGATTADVLLLAKHITPSLRIKTAGGIATLADAEAMVACGASRLGTSRMVRLIKEQTK